MFLFLFLYLFVISIFYVCMTWDLYFYIFYRETISYAETVSQ